MAQSVLGPDVVLGSFSKQASADHTAVVTFYPLSHSPLQRHLTPPAHPPHSHSLLHDCSGVC